MNNALRFGADELRGGGARPLVVDLDGTLILSDMLHETAVGAVKNSPQSFFAIPFWLAQGKARLKRELALRAGDRTATVPVNEELLELLKVEKASGRRLVLCTASDRSIAIRFAERFGIFDEVMASDGHDNLSGQSKAAALVERFGKGAFDYAGNSSADLPVWQVAHSAWVVNASNSVRKRARMLCAVEREVKARSAGVELLLKALRAHQWLKNLLLLVPLLAAHRLTDPVDWAKMALAFLAFSLCASAVYIANDILDLESDREHPRKRHRPFASGRLSIVQGVAMAPILLVCSTLVAVNVSKSFAGWLSIYFLLTCAYSMGLKRAIVMDCIALAMLYTLRIVAGGAAVGQPLSFWLLAFSVFLFLSLAFVKRYAELEVQLLKGKRKAHGRGYYTSDAPLVQGMGLASGYASSMVLALYLNSDAVSKLYKTPEAMWAAVPVLLFWVNWMWVKAHRGEMHDDPLVFAVKDRASLIAGMVFALVLVAGKLGLPW
jgi:4-hydroxybenzoate polyprenyltransferase/phosphoserine phosphatase